MTAASDIAEATARALSARPVRTGRGWLVPCPGHTDTDPSLHLSVGHDGRLLVKCFGGCGQLHVIKALRQRGVWSPAARLRERRIPSPKGAGRGDTINQARGIWAEAKSPFGTLTDLYLADRAIGCAIPPSIRHHPALPYWDAGKMLGRFPALVAAVTDLTSGTLRGVHRIYLSAAIDGAPAGKLVLCNPSGELFRAKKSLGDIDGNGILLGGLSTRHAVFVGEGIETTLSAVSLTGRAGIAAISAGNLPKLRLPPMVRLIYLLLDPDPAGERASREAAAQWYREGRRVRLVEIG